jgi:hypothetical protein
LGIKFLRLVLGVVGGGTGLICMITGGVTQTATDSDHELWNCHA